MSLAAPQVDEEDNEDRHESVEQMSEYNIDSDPEDDMEIGLVQGWVGEIMALDDEQVDDVMNELDELCIPSMTLGEERAAFYKSQRTHPSVGS